MNRISYYLVVIVGILTCAQSGMHAFMGYPAVLEHIRKGEINGEATQGMQIIWLYSSIMMLLSGLWMLFLAKPIKEAHHSARLQVLFLSFGLLAFGMCCTYIAKDLFNHLFFFTVEGMLLLLAVTVFYKSTRHE